MYYDRPGEGTKFFNAIDNRPDGRVDMGGMCILVGAHSFEPAVNSKSGEVTFSKTAKTRNEYMLG